MNADNNKTDQYFIATFYQFVDLPDYQAMQQPLEEFCAERDIKGTILLASEGINATVAGSAQGVCELIECLRSDDHLRHLGFKKSFAPYQPFKRLKIRLKKEIVSLKVPGTNPNIAVGEYVEPERWNEIISDPDVILIDARNDFEVAIGAFHGAVNPHTVSFSEFPQYVDHHLDPNKHTKVAMYCTGGIRCEKATSLLVQLGFTEVYHLKGGILKYLEDTPAEQSLWEGECFVFDERVSVDHALKPGKAKFCPTCKTLLKDGDSVCPVCHAASVK